MSEMQPSRGSSDLAEMVELLLDKGVVINADIVVSVGDTELLGVRLRAAVASFETAAQYGLEFPAGTDPVRVEEVTGAEPQIVGQSSTDGEEESTGDEEESTGDEGESSDGEEESTGDTAEQSTGDGTGDDE
jgi:hypothetical protein